MSTPDPSWGPRQVQENFFEQIWHQGRREMIPALFSGMAGGLAPSAQQPDRSIDVGGYEQLWDLFQATFRDIRVEIVDYLEQGDRGFCRYRFEGTVQRTGARAHFEGAGVIRVADGVMIEAWNAVDWLGLVLQLRDDLPDDLLARALQGSPLADEHEETPCDA